MSEPPLILNGRARGRVTVRGVERWAREVIPRLLALRPERYIAIDPPPGFADWPGQAWEQLVLPARAWRRRAALVFSPANLAPALWPRNVVVVHDVAVLRNPRAYSRPYREWHARVGLECARRALRVVTVSEFSRAELVALAGLDPDRVVVIRGGVDARFSPSADHERVASRYGLDRPYVLTVGTADRRKNLSVLDETARRLDGIGMQLVWAGAARQHIRATPALDSLRALGYVTEPDLPGLYAGARAFVLPSLYEGFGLPCIEAMACGTPVVASDRAGLPEACGDAALLVDPREPRAVAEAVLRAVTDLALRADMRTKGRQHTADASWERTSRELDALLVSLADSR